MKILQINQHSYPQKSYKITPTVLYEKNICVPSQNNNSDFSKSKISFGIKKPYDDGAFANYVVVSKRFDPLNATSGELDNYAEIFHDDDINKLIELKYSGLVGKIFGSNEQKIRKVKDALLPRIRKVKQEKEIAIRNKTNLTAKLVAKEKNVAENKLRITNEFLLPLEYDKQKTEKFIPKGILLYGIATAQEKKEITDWISQKVKELGAEFKEINCDGNDLGSTLISIKNAITIAKEYNKFTQNHTVVYLKNIDKILTNLNDENSLDFIDYFKTIVESETSKSNLTFLISTELPLADFDSAVIGDQRFEIKLNLIPGLTDSEKRVLADASQKLTHLARQAEKADSYTEYKSVWKGY